MKVRLVVNGVPHDADVPARRGSLTTWATTRSPSRSSAHRTPTLGWSTSMCQGRSMWPG